MNKFLIILSLISTLSAFSIDYEVQLDNSHVRVSKIGLDPYEKVGEHRDEYPHVVIAFKGGSVTRFEADGSTTVVEFPENIPVYRSIDPFDELHTTQNGDTRLELLRIEFKDGITLNQ